MTAASTDRSGTAGGGASPSLRTRSPVVVGLRVLVGLAVPVAVLLTGVGSAHGAGTATLPAADSGLNADQARATQLATDIRVQGLRVDQLAEQADAATIHAGQVGATLAVARRTAAATATALAAARSLLTEQAIDAYTEGGHDQLSPVHAEAVSDPGLVGAYGEIIAGTQRNAITVYRQLRRQQTVQEAQLTAAVLEADDAATQLRADRAAAEGAAASEQATLTGIKGQMATLVAAAQAAQVQATANQERAALASEGQLPPSGPAVVTARPARAVTAPATRPTTGPARTTPAARVPATPATSRPPVTAPAPPVDVAADDHSTDDVPPTTVPTVGPPPGSAPGSSTAIAYAMAQLGKPYQWGGAGPATFDCSGLVMDAWGAAGVSFPHLAQSQYDMTARVSISQLAPGDLVFFGTPSNVYHVGIYIGGGDMIDAPATGQNVSIQNIYWSDLLGGGRVS